MHDPDHASTTAPHPPAGLDYSLTGESAQRAIERGLAEAEWYQTPVARETMRQLLERRDGPALRDTILWFALIFGSGFATWWLWPSAWALVPYLAYAVLYGSTSDSRWHEAGHGTAFKTDWMNNALYEIASFMIMRESTVWRWSHTRHHSDTIIVGRDPEIAVPRPPDLGSLAMSFFALKGYPRYFKHILLHSLGWMTPEEKTYIPASEFPQVFWRARVYVAIYAGVLAVAIVTGSILPLLFIGLPNLFGTWLAYVYGLTQHAGLAENVLDHRLNCRTVYMHAIHRYLYWNMNYHVEHHMFPLVPYHALPRLHEVVKADMPQPYPGIVAAYREIIPALLRQRRDPAWHVKRHLPTPAPRPTARAPVTEASPDEEGWIEVCAAADLGTADVMRFDHGNKTFALIRDTDGALYATDGVCTHGNTHLADGLVKDGIIECPKHNGRFHLADGSPARAPICRGLSTYPLEERGGRLWFNLHRPGGAGARPGRVWSLRVARTRSVATFIREIELELVDANGLPEFKPGDYLQFEIPTYEAIRFRDFAIPAPFAAVWERQHVFDLVASHPAGPVKRNNYSLACNPAAESLLRINVRIATPPPGQDCPPGVGSAYMFNLRPGDVVTAHGPYGDFHVKPTQREMVYIGGGAGMAPLRAHLSHLFETQQTARRVSFWYGARSRQEIYYDDYFEQLAAAHANFHFHLALSAPLPEDTWEGHTGFIHQVVRDRYLGDHPNLRAVEFYLCGPPLMIKACRQMLTGLGVREEQIALDEF